MLCVVSKHIKKAVCWLRGLNNNIKGADEKIYINEKLSLYDGKKLTKKTHKNFILRDNVKLWKGKKHN